MLIELGTKQDIDGWMNLVEKVKDAFPGLETKDALNEHKNSVLNFMQSSMENISLLFSEEVFLIFAIFKSEENSFGCGVKIIPFGRIFKSSSICG